MSNLQELKNKLCPNGVEFKKLGEVAEIGTGSSNTDEQLEEGLYPFFVRSPIVRRKNDFEFDETAIITSGDGVGVGKIFHYIEGKYALHQRAYRIHIITNDSLPKFVYYYMMNSFYDYISKKVFLGTVKSIRRNMLTDFEIPIPPLELQEEIVRILDTFTELIKELIKEQELRKKQYSYYRDKLLTFDGDTPNVKLGEVCNFKCGGDVPKGNFSKEKTDKYTIPIYSNGIGKNALYGYTDKAIITQKCVTISSRGTIGYSALREEAFYPIVRLICCFPNENLLPEFLVYAIQTIKFVIPKGGIPQLTIPMLKEYKIPLPPLDTQKRIVDILDNFERYTNDLQKGLPAEIEKRKKQYAYYRDELLRFERK